MQEGLVSPFQQAKISIYVHKCFAFSELTLQMLIPFQFLRDKDPFLRDAHTFITSHYVCPRHAVLPANAKEKTLTHTYTQRLADLITPEPQLTQHGLPWLLLPHTKTTAVCYFVSTVLWMLAATQSRATTPGRLAAPHLQETLQEEKDHSARATVYNCTLIGTMEMHVSHAKMISLRKVSASFFS